MSGPRFNFVPVMGHEVHVTEWGQGGAPALLMLHGLARTGRDFDEIASALSDHYHVLCPDMIGRGRSSWSANPTTDYRVESYAKITLGLMDAYGLDSADFLGTSMGGQIGMWIASGDQHARLNTLLINDIGPEVPAPAIQRIMAYVGNPPQFATHTEAEVWLRKAYAPFGPAPDAFWQRMALASLRRTSSGQLTLHYDPAIISQFTHAPQDMTVWDRWQSITTPTHVFYGEQSDLLTQSILQQMLGTGPKPSSTGICDCGHAPTLSRPADIEQVRTAFQTLG